MFAAWDTFSRWVSRVGAIVGRVFIFLLMLLITVDIIGRYFGYPTMVAHEMSAYLLVAITFIGLSYALRTGSHIEVTVVRDRLSPKARWILMIVTSCIATIFCGWLTWVTLNVAIESLTQNTTSITIIRTPFWIPQSFISLGLAMITIELITETVRRITGQPQSETHITESV